MGPSVYHVLDMYHFTLYFLIFILDPFDSNVPAFIYKWTFE